jgi:hypothetical protein
MTPELAQSADHLTPGQLTVAYLKVRGNREELRAQLKLIDAKLDIIEELLLRKLDALELDSFNAGGSVVYTADLITARVIDREMVFDFIRDSGLLELLEARVSKEAVQLYAENNGGALPPGVELHKMVRLNVRKAPKKR